MPDKEKRKEIESVVDNILSTHALNKPAFDLAAFLTGKENFKIGIQELPKGTTGLLLVNEQEFVGETMTHNLILINSSLQDEPNFLQRRRYIAAHEYGHYVLHKKGKEIFAHRDYKHKEAREEKEADYFARCLLMPRDLVEKTISLFDAVNSSIEEKSSLIAKTFNVTENKARIRLTKDLVG